MDRQIARWRLRSQHLSAPHVESAAQVVEKLLCVQAENPNQSAWAVAARTTSSADDLASLLDSGAVLRTHVLRPTWHYALREDLDWLLALTGPRVRPAVDQQLVGATGLQPREVDAMADAVLAALGAAPDLNRSAVGDAVRDRVPHLADRLTGHVLMLLMARLELDRFVCSGRPANGEHTYALWSDRVGARMEMDDDGRDEALARLVVRYFTGHGPATVKDLSYWATLPVGQVRRGVDAAREDLASFEHDGRVYFHAPGRPPVDAPAEPAGHLVQLLDEIYRGYQDSRWVLDAEGIAPRGRETTIGIAVVDGQLVGGMKRTVQRTRVRFEIHPFRGLSTDEQDALQSAADRYGRFLGLDADVVHVGTAAAD